MQSRATSPGLCNEGTGVPVSIELRSGQCLETERLRPLAKMAGAITLTLALMLPAGAQDYSVIGVKLQNRANDVLAVMGFQVVPDLTTSSLSINDAGGENPTLLMSQIGAGFASVAQKGSEHGDEMTPDGFLSNHAGGVLGGISTGQPVVCRFAVKPTSSILTPRKTIDRDGNDAEIVTKGRHDPCVGIRAVPVGEAMMAIVLADHFLRHRGQCG